MTDIQRDESEWVSCPVGTLQEAAEKFRFEQARRTRYVYVRTIVAALLLIVVGFGVASLRNQPTRPSANLTCAEVAELSDDLVAGNLDATVAQQVLEHFAECEKCRQAFQQAYPDYDLALAVNLSPNQAGFRLAML